MYYSLRSSVVIIALVATLAMAPVAPEAGNVIFLTLGGLSLTLIFRSAREDFYRPIVWMPITGLGLIAVSYVLGSKSLEGLVGLAFFSPLFAIWPLLAAAEEMKSDDSSVLISALALTGVAGAAIVALIELIATGTVRAGGGVANPIHFADVALLIGFVACTGLVVSAELWRFAFLFGPLLASVAVTLSGTRGAVVAIAAMLTVAVLGLIGLRLVSLKVALTALAVAVTGVAVAVLVGAGRLSGIQRVLIDVEDVIQYGLPTDGSTATRLQMIAGGIKAFLQAPIFGNGPNSFVHLANELSEMPPGNWPHLHNDLADFAASAGTLGLIAYGLFLLAPVAEVFRLPKTPTRSRLLVLVATLIAGFFVMGLTNAMFGILTITVTYSVICLVTGIVVAQAKHLRDA